MQLIIVVSVKPKVAIRHSRGRGGYLEERLNLAVSSGLCCGGFIQCDLNVRISNRYPGRTVPALYLIVVGLVKPEIAN